MTNHGRGYSNEEKAELRKIKSMPNRTKEKTAALKAFADKHGRTLGALYPALKSLRKERKTPPKERVVKTAAQPPAEFRIKYKSVRVEGDHLVFEL